MNSQILAEQQAPTAVIARVEQPRRSKPARHSLEDIMQMRARLADQQAAKEQPR